MTGAKGTIYVLTRITAKLLFSFLAEDKFGLWSLAAINLTDSKKQFSGMCSIKYVQNDSLLHSIALKTYYLYTYSVTYLLIIAYIRVHTY